MRVIELRDAFGLDHLVAGERPDPPAPGPGEVCIRIEAASLNYRDLVMAEGGYGNQRLPLIPVSDGAGHIVSVGPDVSSLSEGDLVTPTFARGWTCGVWKAEYRKQTLGGPVDGVLREFMLAREIDLVKAPHEFTAAEAATLPCAAVTAWNAVVVQGGAKPGHTVVIQGTGGVALFALQFAKLVGARTIVTSSSETKLERARRLGADVLVNYRSEPEWGDVVRRETGGGADLVIELGGSETLKQSLRAVRPGGVIAMIGVLSGPIAQIPLAPIVMQHIGLQGVTVGSRELHREMVSAMDQHGLRPVIDRTYPMEETAEALRYLKQGLHFGKIVLHVSA